MDWGGRPGMIPPGVTPLEYGLRFRFDPHIRQHVALFFQCSGVSSLVENTKPVGKLPTLHIAK